MNEERRDNIYELLKRGLKLVESGEELPTDWARQLFPPERREYELLYYGKESEEQILADTMAVPLQPVSTFGEGKTDWQNKLIFGDNLQAMKTLIDMKEKGKLINSNGLPGVRLVYIDPPFATKRDFHGNQDQKAYQDKVAGAEFLEFMRKRLILLKELLSEDGCIYVHLDWKKTHYVKILMDEVFGEQNFLGDISWYYYNKMASGTRKFSSAHDKILFYAKNKNLPYVFHPLEEKRDKAVKQLKRKYEDGKAVNAKDEHGAVQYQIREMRRVDDVWRIACLQPADKTQNTGYPTQKPEALLERIISASSDAGDIVLDAFAGAGTTSAVAEKLGRKWIAIDCGKLSIYTIQKRMLTLGTDIGNKGKALKPKPFTLYNAGLYDFETLKKLPWEDWRSIALQLFECKDEPHAIRGFQLDGKRQGSSVYVYNHFESGQISEDTIRDLHLNIGKQVGDKCFIIAPRGAFLFQEDYLEMDGVRYYALRIPYSYINELHRREFSALAQPADETSVNETVEAVGFDFIQPPLLELETKTQAGMTEVHVAEFKTRARIRGTQKTSKHKALSMVMVDYDYNGKVFAFDQVFYGEDLQKTGWTLQIPTKDIGARMMLVFIDIYGNESRVVIEGKQSPVKKAPRKTAKK